ncbi:carbamate kinase [Bowmanella dokdonensis]|uniref:Carbamate kinase n=1 Tax=Bowmanella dokdonensis TaxID=751969 RepID=A0A939DMV2_9ALTE|nr:carbamate kinase [Bowmanella dokdonensis]MBN7825515.1 carbamate kinase [Bowmanella dokdonensis]
MKVVVALGGNALASTKEGSGFAGQIQQIRYSGRILGGLAGQHQLIVTHGNGPQIGVLAAQARESEQGSLPLDVIGAQTEGMLGYLLEQELVNHLPEDRMTVSLITMVEADAEDPAFAQPTKPIGAKYSAEQGEALAQREGWQFRKSPDGWQRLVPSPKAMKIFQIPAIKVLLARGALVICSGGGGIPMINKNNRYQGVEAVVDKDDTSALLATELDADVLVLATDVDGVYENWSSQNPSKITATTPDELEQHEFEAGSMAPKVEAACRFVRHRGGRACIGALDDLQSLVAGQAGTQILQAAGSNA